MDTLLRRLFSLVKNLFIFIYCFPFRTYIPDLPLIHSSKSNNSNKVSQPCLFFDTLTIRCSPKIIYVGDCFACLESICTLNFYGLSGGV